ncbi:MAG: DUF5518 domain-containing protein [Halodesulfurarchaeum sp.]
MGQGDTLLNAVIGAVISVVLAFLPFSPVLGGAVAGYLQRGSRRGGLRVGAISGLITMLPLFGVGVVFGGAFFVPVFGMDPGALLSLGIVLIGVIAFFVLYTVALAAVGGYVGVYVATETGIGS